MAHRLQRIRVAEQTETREPVKRKEIFDTILVQSGSSRPFRDFPVHQLYQGTILVFPADSTCP